MFQLTPSMSYYLYSRPTDLRKGFYTLSGLVSNHMGHNVQDGHVYLFLNRSRTSIKLLHMECGGLVIYHMKLDRGTFQLPIYDPNTNTFQTSWYDLQRMIRGASTEKKTQKKFNEMAKYSEK